MKERIILCKIEMEMIEGEHFNHNLKKLDRKTAIVKAMDSFIETIKQIADVDSLEDYVQAKVVDDGS